MTKRLIEMKKAGEKIAALTAYDAAFARLLQAAGVDCILVGDSLGMVIKGERDTLNVKISEVAYHTRAVAAGAPKTPVIGDMPFGSFQKTPQSAFANAAKLLAAGASMVKIEGGECFADTVRFLTERGVPVCAHVGLMPQQVRASGGYYVQGKGDAGEQVMQDARAMQQAGASMVVLELLPAALAAKITAALEIPTIGIGSGAACDGQILVLYDALGISGRQLKMSPDFLAGNGSAQNAIAAYARAVKSGEFPGEEHTVA